ncbi:TadE/TadG family type IV pilus assembly protein [Vibrio ishigakensis]|uniref:TadE/TadG family type IV pilus assembly protein n=1 Tax=Vibrio ishigakensis TaxID=1481914 RepID=UPI0021C3C4B5|nr:TadE family protein [Vibrio ishigakensis]
MTFIKKRKEGGLAIIEFTIVSTVLLLLLFGIIEIGRFLFSLQMLNEITRKAARLATVCFIVDDSTLNTTDFGSTYNSPIDLTTLTLDIDYLDEAGGSVSSPTTESGFGTIRYVRARISGFSYSFSVLAGLFGTLTNIDAFETTLPSESLGVYRPYVNDSGTLLDPPPNAVCQTSSTP